MSSHHPFNRLITEKHGLNQAMAVSCASAADSSSAAGGIAAIESSKKIHRSTLQLPVLVLLQQQRLLFDTI